MGDVDRILARARNEANLGTDRSDRERFLSTKLACAATHLANCSASGSNDTNGRTSLEGGTRSNANNGGKNELNGTTTKGVRVFGCLHCWNSFEPEDFDGTFLQSEFTVRIFQEPSQKLSESYSVRSHQDVRRLVRKDSHSRHCGCQ
jgi:hypothetical protein